MMYSSHYVTATIRAVFILLVVIFKAVGEINAAPLRVVASTADLAAVAREVGGDRISIEIICRPDQDPHSLEILPRQVVSVQQADVYLRAGLDLDLWASDLIRSAGNPRLIVADCSEGIEIIGSNHEHAEHHDHIHPTGNPHYALGPANLYRVAENIRDALTLADSERKEFFQAGYAEFTAQLDSALKHWRDELVLCRGAGLVSAHAEWDYFARDFGLRIVGIVSPIPDAEPTPAHLAQLVRDIRAGGTCIFLKEPFTPDRIPQVLARDTGIPVITVPSAVGAMPQSQDIWSHFDFLVGELAAQCSGKR